MILASITADPRIGVDDTELDRKGVSFTVDTVAEIIERYRPDGKPGLVIGDDLAAEFHKWKRADELAEKTGIIVARRMAAAPDFRYPHTTLRNGIMPVSSAMIRERIARESAGSAWRSLVPPGARRIIEERGLYGLFRAGTAGHIPAEADGGQTPDGGCAPDGGRVPGALLSAVEEAARAALKRSRFLHSRNTALMAFDLARRYGLDPGAAYLAGIAHDLGKSLETAELLALAERDGGGFSALERKNPALLHGRAAAVLLRERFGIHNKDVLEAVAAHTTGSRDMGPLAMAVFIADKIEYSRGKAAARLRERLGGKETLTELFFAVLEENIRYLKSERLDVAEETLALESGIKSGAKSGIRRACETGR
jgi:nicotinate-nucleotide adenylyltransferase